jgi:hypothetical protein
MSPKSVEKKTLEIKFSFMVFENETIALFWAQAVISKHVVNENTATVNRVKLLKFKSLIL